jgi:hypothetical protein
MFSFFLLFFRSLVDLVDEYKEYAVGQLPKIGKHLRLPSNNPRMEIYGIVSCLVQWYLNKDSSMEEMVYEQALHIPILCSLCIS